MRTWKGFSFFFLWLNLCLWMAGALLPVLQWQRARLCFAAVGAAVTLLWTSDLSFPTACTDFSGWELLKSLECQLFETLQSDGTEMNTDHVDFFSFWGFSPRGALLSGAHWASWQILCFACQPWFIFAHFVCHCNSAFKDIMWISTHFHFPLWETIKRPVCLALCLQPCI